MADALSDSDQIEADLARTRSRMDQRLEQLQAHLTPKQMLNDAFAYFRGGDGTDIMQDMLSRVRANPMPLALVGVGLAWLIASNAEGRTEAAPHPKMRCTGGGETPTHRPSVCPTRTIMPIRRASPKHAAWSSTSPAMPTIQPPPMLSGSALRCQVRRARRRTRRTILPALLATQSEASPNMSRTAARNSSKVPTAWHNRHATQRLARRQPIRARRDRGGRRGRGGIAPADLRAGGSRACGDRRNPPRKKDATWHRTSLIAAPKSPRIRSTPSRTAPAPTV